MKSAPSSALNKARGAHLMPAGAQLQTGDRGGRIFDSVHVRAGSFWFRYAAFGVARGDVTSCQSELVFPGSPREALNGCFAGALGICVCLRCVAVS